MENPKKIVEDFDRFENIGTLLTRFLVDGYIDDDPEKRRFMCFAMPRKKNQKKVDP